MASWRRSSSSVGASLSGAFGLDSRWISMHKGSRHEMDGSETAMSSLPNWMRRISLSSFGGARQPRRVTAYLGHLRGARAHARAAEVLQKLQGLRVERNVFHYTAITSALGDCVQWRGALLFLSRALNDEAANAVTWSAAKKALARAEGWRKALELMKTMSSWAIQGWLGGESLVALKSLRGMSLAALQPSAAWHPLACGSQPSACCWRCSSVEFQRMS